jgi:mgtE-like transporter
VNGVIDAADRLPARAATALTRAAARLLAGLRRTGRFRLLREVLAHWLQERHTIRQGFVALALCISLTLIAGVTLAAIERLLDEQPGLLVLVPAAIGMRGAIFGALGARLGTGMLTGQFSLVPERRSFTGQNVEAAALLTLITAALLAVLAWLLAEVIGSDSISVFALMIISMIGALVSSVFVLAVVLLLASVAARRSWDMDAIGTPIISATADLTTIPALALATLALGFETVTPILGGIFLAGAVGACVVGLRNRGELARRVVRESLPVLFYTAIMGILAGTVLQARLDSLSQALLIAVPSFIAASGAIGGILSARLSSQLHVGLVRPRPLPERPAALEGSLTVLFGLAAFATVGVCTQIVAVLTGFASPGAARLAGITTTGGLLAVGILFVVAYYAATASYRYGLDPDNVSIPVVTSTMDFFGILCLVVGISLFGGR